MEISELDATVVLAHVNRRNPSPRLIISKTDLAALLGAKHPTPHSVLGMHPLTYRRSHGVVVRALLRDATACEVIEVDAQPPKAPRDDAHCARGRV